MTWNVLDEIYNEGVYGNTLVDFKHGGDRYGLFLDQLSFTSLGITLVLGANQEKFNFLFEFTTRNSKTDFLIIYCSHY